MLKSQLNRYIKLRLIFWNLHYLGQYLQAIFIECVSSNSNYYFASYFHKFINTNFHQIIFSSFRPDCVEILRKCRNTTSHMASLSPENICDALSPPGKQAPCISLKAYLGLYLNLLWHPHIYCKIYHQEKLAPCISHIENLGMYCGILSYNQAVNMVSHSQTLCIVHVHILITSSNHRLKSTFDTFVNSWKKQYPTKSFCSPPQLANISLLCYCCDMEETVWQLLLFIQTYSGLHCVVPENIHTPTMEGIGNCRGVGGSKAQEIPEGWGDWRSN